MSKSKIETVKVSAIKPNPKNPRKIRDDQFKKLKQSIEQFPEMLNYRPLIIDDDMMILGGNSRFKAILDLGWEEVPVLFAKDFTEEQKKLFVIKDNVSSGEWDWDALANQWEAEVLNNWGMSVWVPESTEEKFEPNLNPLKAVEPVTKGDIAGASQNLGSGVKQGLERDLADCTCPECNYEFKVEIK